MFNTRWKLFDERLAKHYTPVECEWLRVIGGRSLSSKSRRDVSIETVTHRSRRAHLWAKERVGCASEGAPSVNL